MLQTVPCFKREGLAFGFGALLLPVLELLLKLLLELLLPGDCVLLEAISCAESCIKLQSFNFDMVLAVHSAGHFTQTYMIIFHVATSVPKHSGSGPTRFVTSCARSKC